MTEKNSNNEEAKTASEGFNKQDGTPGLQSNETSSETVSVPVISSYRTPAQQAESGKPQKRTVKVKTYWGGTAILGSVVVFLITQVVLAIGLIVYILLEAPDYAAVQQSATAVTELLVGNPILLIVSQLSMYLAWLGCMWWVTRYRSGVQLGKKFWTAFKENFWIAFKKRDILIGLGIAAGMMLFQLAVLNGLPAIFPDLNMEGAGNTDLFEQLDGIWFFIVAFGLGGIIGPICEELFFRGFLLRGFVNHYSYSKAKRNIDVLEEELGKQSFFLKNIVISVRGWVFKHRYAISIAITSILFGFMHFQGFETFGQWLVIIVTGFLGLVLAITTYKTQRLAPAIIAHVVYNSTAFALLLVS